MLLFSFFLDNSVCLFGKVYVTSHFGLVLCQRKRTLPHSPFFIVLLYFFMICISFVFRSPLLCLKFQWGQLSGPRVHPTCPPAKSKSLFYISCLPFTSVWVAAPYPVSEYRCQGLLIPTLLLRDGARRKKMKQVQDP